MARSPALREVLTVAAAASAGWLALVAILFQLVPATPSRTVNRVHPVASHRAPSAPWHGAVQVYDEVERRARALPPEDRVRVARAILEEAARAELAPLLVLAVIHVESRFDPAAVSPVGAVGLMQLMRPTFHAEVAAAPHAPADPFDPVANVRAGVRYLGRLVGTFSSVELALVAYNAGPGRLRRLLQTGGVPDRLRRYPRDVLREAVRLWPAPLEAPAVALAARPARVLALGAAHGPAAPAAAPGRALALRDGAPGAVAPATLAALEAGAAELAGDVLASSGPPLPRPDAGGEAQRAGPSRDACVRLEVGLPMSRGRDRATAAAARVLVRA